MSMRTILKSWIFWFFLWLCFMGLLVFCQVGQATDYSPSIKTFGLIDGNEWDAWQGYQRDTAWEAEHFDIIISGFDFLYYPMATYDTVVANYRHYNPNIKFYQYNSMTTAWMSGLGGGGVFAESLRAYYAEKGLSVEDGLIHFHRNTPYGTLDIFGNFLSGGFAPGWADSNDTNSDGVRDWIAEANILTEQGLSWFTDTTKSWTANEWVGYGLYDWQGNLVDTVTGNSADSVWWNEPIDTSEIITNGDFETGDFTGWDSIETCVDSSSFFIDTTTHYGGSYSAKIVLPCSSGTPAVWLRRKITNPHMGTYIFYFAYKTTDTLNPSVFFRGFPGNYSYTLNGTDSLDNDWHLSTTTIINYSYDDSFLIYFGFQTNYGGYYLDSGWIDNVSLKRTSEVFTGYVGEYETYTPQYAIDELGAPNHTASAMAESLSRYYIGNWDLKIALTNPKDTAFQDFWVNRWLTSELTKWDTLNGFMVDEISKPIYLATGDMDFVEYTGTGTPHDMNDTAYYNNRLRMLTKAKDTVEARGKELIGNLLPAADSSFMFNMHGGFMEGTMRPRDTRASTWNEWRDFRNWYFDGWNGNINFNFGFAWLQISDQMPRIDCIWSGYYAQIHDFYNDDTNKAQISSLAHYLIIAGDSTFYFWGIRGQSGYSGTGHLYSRDNWYEAMEYNYGLPVDTCYLDTTGIDIDGDTFIIVRRNLVTANGDTNRAYFKPMHSGTGWVTTQDTTTTLITLDGVWVKMKADNSSDPDFDGHNLYLQYSEGAILLKLSCE